MMVMRKGKQKAKEEDLEEARWVLSSGPP